MKKTYSKPPLTYDEQIDLLISRGLNVPNREEAILFLSQINYYRFSAYCLPFELSRHKFRTSVAFNDIKELYEFDRRLRFLIDEVLEVIETSLRSNFCYFLVHKYGVFMHEDKGLFYNHKKYSEWIEKVHSEILRSKETFVSHFMNNYEGFPRLPLWVAVEVMSFGSLSQLYNNLYKQDQIAIAKSIGFHSKVLSSWLHALSYIRNICAHHCRLWNRELAIAMVLPDNSQWENINSRRIGSVIFAILHMLLKLPVDRNIIMQWRKKTEDLFQTSINMTEFYLSIGMPENFTCTKLWSASK